MSDYLSYAELKAQILLKAGTAPLDEIISDAVCALSDEQLTHLARERPEVYSMHPSRYGSKHLLPDMLESNFRDLLEEEVEEALCPENKTPSCASPPSP